MSRTTSTNRHDSSIAIQEDQPAHKPIIIYRFKPKQFSCIQILAENELLLWKIARSIHTKSKQSIPRFVGRVIKNYQEVDTKKTVITYLLPINKPISNYSTVSIPTQKLAQV